MEFLDKDRIMLAVCCTLYGVSSWLKKWIAYGIWLMAYCAKVMVKVVPLSTSLSTEILPPRLVI